jgi:hypothetical protein
MNERHEAASCEGEHEISCEACSATGASVSGAAAPCALSERLFWLCPLHRAQAESAPDGEALRALFREHGGQRSALPRRTDDRRVFPPRPEGRRRGGGRRRADPDV